MARVWMCDRCDKVSRSGDDDDPPEEWNNYDLPVRGSTGARSRMVRTICSTCDDSLYEWLTSGGET